MSVRRMLKSRFLILTALMVVALGVANAAPIFIAINPQTSFLRTDPGDASGVYFIDFSSLGIVAGDTLLLQTVGDFCMGSGSSCPEYAVPLIAAFTSGTTLGPQADLYRITPISSGAPGVTTGNTYYSSLTTDIDNDFEIPLGSPLAVVVPGGAAYLAVGVTDTWYKDNSDPTSDLGIMLEVSQVPEPGTILLLASGIGLMVAFRRRRKA